MDNYPTPSECMWLWQGDEAIVIRCDDLGSAIVSPLIRELDVYPPTPLVTEQDRAMDRGEVINRMQGVTWPANTDEMCRIDRVITGWLWMWGEYGATINRAGEPEITFAHVYPNPPAVPYDTQLQVGDVTLHGTIVHQHGEESVVQDDKGLDIVLTHMLTRADKYELLARRINECNSIAEVDAILRVEVKL